GVEHQSEADRHTLVAEVRHLLQLVLFVHDEVVLSEPRDEAAVAIDDGCRDVDEIDAALEAKFVLILSRHARTTGDDGHGERCRETDRGAQHMFHGQPSTASVYYAPIAMRLRVL